ncbi:MAG TPA: hypothetical protein VL651_05635 [Bacteroidia bacterium]|jgi:hypothetical protein|nr:hypothetical protein [Bacteroidia bacterium]
MKRILPICFILFLSFLTSCDDQHHFLGTIIKKRVYLDGFYVHVPGKRETDPNEYPPPSQYPQQYTHIADISRYRDSMYQLRQDSIRAAIAYKDSMAQVYATAYARDTAVHYYNNPYPTSYGNPAPYYNPYSYSRPDTIHRYVTRTINVTHYVTDTIRNYIYRDSVTRIVKNDTIVRHDTLRQVVTYDSIIPVYDTMYVTKMDSVHHTTEIDFIKPAPKKPQFPPTDVMGFAQVGEVGIPDGNVYAVKAGSNAFGFGLRSKSLITRHGSVIMDLSYRRDELFPMQSAMKTSPFIPGMYDKERMKMHEFSGVICWRHTFKKHFRKPSYWVDAGVFGEQIFRSKDVAIAYDNSSPLGDHMKTRIKVTGLAGLKKKEAGVTARFGRGDLAGFVTYRITDLVKPGYGAGDMPRLTIGFDLTLSGEK